MRFGIFALHISTDPAHDIQVIDKTLKEAELAEDLGFDCFWLVEHHFDGAAGYADPLILGAAIAAKTRRIKIGFAVVQLALHHPVRLAVQTSVLDNLSKGRLLVGTGRGSLYSHYEYMGFGVTLEQGREMMDEAEELLVKAWSGGPVNHVGKFWKVSFPSLRPLPYQKPHPILMRACVTEESVIEMAKLGRPIQIGFRPAEELGHRLKLYEDTMVSTGFDEETVENVLDQTWVHRQLFLADSDQEAAERLEAASEKQLKYIRENRDRHNPSTTPLPPPGHTVAPQHISIVGTPKSAIEQISYLKDLGMRNLMFSVDIGEMTFDQASKNMRLFSEKVGPHFSN